MNVTLEKSVKLDRGERLIVVDRVVWGRTFVTHHGVHGDRHMFHQEHGETIGDVTKNGSFIPVCVRSTKRRKYLENDPWRPTYELVLEKAIELINAGRLRHPDSVKQEKERLGRKMKENADRRAREEQAEFEAKAREALGIAHDLQDQQTELVARIVAAMRWAQEQ